LGSSHKKTFNKHTHVNSTPIEYLRPNLIRKIGPRPPAATSWTRPTAAGTPRPEKEVSAFPTDFSANRVRTLFVDPIQGPML
jgi:hypothetical protein